MTDRNHDAGGDELLALLAEDARIEPPEGLDRALVALLSEKDPPLLSPGMAAGLAGAGFLALSAALSALLAASGAGEYGVPVVFSVGSLYLAVSAAASLPLLLFRRRLASVQSREVKA